MMDTDDMTHVIRLPEYAPTQPKKKLVAFVRAPDDA
jgi:hypothetical protein